MRRVGWGLFRVGVDGWVVGAVDGWAWDGLDRAGQELSGWR